MAQAGNVELIEEEEFSTATSPWGFSSSAGNSSTDHSKSLLRLRKMGADTNDLDAEWMRLQEQTAADEHRRRTGGFETLSPTAESPHTHATEHDHGDVYHPPHHSFSEVEKQLMNQYESLDYDIVNSELAEKELSDRTYWTVKCDWISKWVIFALIGIMTGTLAAFVAKIVELIQEFKFETSLEYLRDGDTFTACFFFVGISVAFGLIATCLVNFVEPVAAGSGIPQLKAYLNGTSYARLLQMKTLVVKVRFRSIFLLVFFSFCCLFYFIECRLLN